MQAKKLQEALGQLGSGPAALGYPAGALHCCELLGSCVHTFSGRGCSPALTQSSFQGAFFIFCVKQAQHSKQSAA